MSTETKPGTQLWPPDEIKAARERLGLTLTEMAAMLDTDAKSLRCMEMDPAVKMARTPPPRLVRLLEAYLDGYRPADWPGCE